MALVVDLPPEEPRSVLPGGGSPADDKAYLAWRDAFLIVVADRWSWHGCDHHPPRIEGWRLDGWLYRRLSDNGLFDSMTNYSHRLRYLAICYRDRRRELLRAAASFVEEATKDVRPT